MKNNGLKYALMPLAWIYGFIVWLRNKLFDNGLLPVEEFDIPVISIGNIAVGGTGKTPHTEYLIRLLGKKHKIAVLSRGYKRRSYGFVLADENTSAESIGDEPFQIHRKFPEILVAVDANRRRGIRQLLSLPQDRRPEIILLDDAFQHRYVKPSLSILLIAFEPDNSENCLLPAGRLREPVSGIIRADIVVTTKCPYPLPSSGAGRGICSAFRYKSLRPLFPTSNVKQKESLERLKNEGFSFLLVAGLANPKPMEDYLLQYTTDLHPIFYPDHHYFSEKDLKYISNEFDRINNDKKLLITSEKDAARLVGNEFFPEKTKPFAFYLPLEVVFSLEDEQLFNLKIEQHVAEFKRNRNLAS
ncbi:MAG: tetraacyldisaccharide 4'-kinase [Dysgonamonadaceae bacterium]|nr:tetraacyldisaccharide 4'-kinase [Dysgonamonadaceae bacterium]